MKNIEKFLNVFPKLAFLFLAIQPILDLLSTLSIRYFQLPITIGIITRFTFMIFAAGYIVLSQKSKLKNFFISVLLGISVVSLIGFILALINKPQIELLSEIQFYAKGIYFLIILFTYTLVFKGLETEYTLGKILKYTAIAMTIVGLVFIITTITGTGIQTYEFVKHAKLGFKGWFHAGNEIGAILSICSPIVFLFGSVYTNTIKQIYYWLPMVLVAISVAILGTKASYLSLVISLGLGLAILFLDKILQKEKNISSLNLKIAAVILAITLVFTPFIPAFSNTVTDMTIEREPIENLEELQGISAKYADNAFFKLLKPLLSTRDLYFMKMHDDFVKSPTVQKIFGMGYAGNYTKTPKLVEMDVFDLFYSYGFLGTALYFAPLLLILAQFRCLRRKMITKEFLIIGVGLSLGFGISTLAGHVIFAPAVSIYLAVLLSYIYRVLDCKSKI